jgi:hypothetical protein
VLSIERGASRVGSGAAAAARSGRARRSEAVQDIQGVITNKWGGWGKVKAGWVNPMTSTQIMSNRPSLLPFYI